MDDLKLSRGVRRPDATCWRICQTGRWHGIDLDTPSPIDDSIRVTVYPRLVDVHWDVLCVAPEALATLFDWLDRRRHNGRMLTALHYRYGGWNNELFESVDQAMRRIAETGRYADTVPFTGTMRRRLPLDRAFNGRPQTADMMDAWLRLGGRLTAHDLAAMAGLMRRSLIFRFIANDESFIYAHAGNDSMASRVMGSGWSDKVIGRRAEDCFSDEEYENDVCADYAPVLKCGEARFHHFRAFIRLPGKAPGWYNYERLALPWVAPSGERILAIFCTQSQDLDIPFLSPVA